MSATNEPNWSHRCWAEFEFDLAGPLFEQMRDLLESVEPVPLNKEHTSELSERPGVYLLRHQGTPVYIGKADDSVKERLGRHARTLLGRRNLAVGDMTFCCITFAATWNPFLPEGHLIEHYKTAGSHGWNGKGFGSNEPGVNRGKTRLREDNFYRRYPLRDDWVCETIPAGEQPSTLNFLKGRTSGPIRPMIQDEPQTIPGQTRALPLRPNPPQWKRLK